MLESFLGLIVTITSSRLLHLVFAVQNVDIQFLVANFPNQSNESFVTFSNLKYIDIVGIPFIFALSLSQPASNVCAQHLSVLSNAII